MFQSRLFHAENKQYQPSGNELHCDLPLNKPQHFPSHDLYMRELRVLQFLHGWQLKRASLHHLNLRPGVAKLLKGFSHKWHRDSNYVCVVTFN